jgi:predicted small secreted protein
MLTKINARRSPVPLVLAVLALVFSGFAVTGCNTLSGAGEDAENAGDAVQDAID